MIHGLRTANRRDCTLCYWLRKLGPSPRRFGVHEARSTEKARKPRRARGGSRGGGNRAGFVMCMLCILPAVVFHVDGTRAVHIANASSSDDDRCWWTSAFWRGVERIRPASLVHVSGHTTAPMIKAGGTTPCVVYAGAGLWSTSQSINLLKPTLLRVFPITRFPESTVKQRGQWVRCRLRSRVCVVHVSSCVSGLIVQCMYCGGRAFHRESVPRQCAATGRLGTPRVRGNFSSRRQHNTRRAQMLTRVCGFWTGNIR